MKRTIFGLVTVLLALGLLLTGCSNPIEPNNQSNDLGLEHNASIVTGNNGHECDTFILSYGESSYVYMNGETRMVVEFILQCPVCGASVQAYCADLTTTAYDGNTYKLVSAGEYFTSNQVDQLMAALTYIGANYGYLKDTDSRGYWQVAQAVIWNILYGYDIDSVYDENWRNKRELQNTIRDINGRLDELVTAYKAGVAMEGTAVKDQDKYGPYSVSDNIILANVPFDLSVNSGAIAEFVNAAGEPVTQVLPGEKFWVQIVPGATGTFEFTAKVSPANEIEYVNDFYFFVDRADGNVLIGSKPYNFKYQPLVGFEMGKFFGSCSAFFIIPDLKPPKGSIDILKTVDGINISAKYSNMPEIYNLIQTFKLYKVNANNDPIEGLTPVAEANVNAQGKLLFSKLELGWYAVKEVLTDAGKLVFEEAPIMYIYVNSAGSSIGGTFDYDAFYTIVNGYNRPGSRILGYPGLNNNGDLFYIAVTNTGTGVEYVSFCANAGSKNFAGEGGVDCSGYYKATSGNEPKYLAAFNYIEKTYGSLNENRAITQTVIWAILGAVDVNSPLFEATNLAGWEKAAVRDVMANLDYDGFGGIVDVVYMVCDRYPEHSFEFCQPQIVPVYAEKSVFDNKELPPPTMILGPSYGSVTATNAGNVPLILAGLNPKNGNPYYGDKKEADTPFVVPNSNHFVYAEFSRADLEDGVWLDMVVGNKYEIVGQAFVQMEGGNIVITLEGKGSFGATAFNKLPVPKNGNIHTQKEADLKKDFGATTGFAHNNVAVLPCPAGDTIWLYIHCDTWQFYQ